MNGVGIRGMGFSGNYLGGCFAAVVLWSIPSAFLVCEVWFAVCGGRGLSAVVQCLLEGFF